MTLKISKRSDISMFRALDILRQVNELKASGQDIVNLAPGQPCVGAPAGVLKYAHEMIDADPRQGYTDAIGMLSLRQKIADFYQSNYALEVSSDNIVITMGSSCGFLLAFLSAFDAGDTIALATPTYAAYSNIIKALGLNIVEIETSAETNYQPTAKLLNACEEKFDGLIICSPSNPTGTMISKEEMANVCAWCDAHNVRVISDEAYHGITYEEKAQSALKFTSNAIILNTFSKYFAMTGWRLGWMVIPSALTDRVKKLAESLFVSPSTLSQQIACKIFDHQSELDEYVQTYKTNRDLLLAGLKEAGIEKTANAQGAFYIYADVSHLTNDTQEYCKNMLSDAKIATTPGIDFDQNRGHQTIRLSYAGETKDIIEACKRLKEWRK